MPYMSRLIFQTYSEKTETSANKGEGSSATEAVKVSLKKTQNFVPFSKAVQHSFKSLSPKKQKKLSPTLFATLGKLPYLRKGPESD